MRQHRIGIQGDWRQHLIEFSLGERLRLCRMRRASQADADHECERGECGIE